MNCPCCFHPTLRHIRNQQIYWFCRHCWQEVPNFDQPKRTHSLPLICSAT